VYEVTVVTSDRRGAGTDSRVSLVLFGSRGHSAELLLDNARDNFSRGRTDVFQIRWVAQSQAWRWVQPIAMPGASAWMQGLLKP
jgi:hypothetical protein